MKGNNNTILSTDPLSELTRKERKYLLLVSFIAFAMTQAGLIPSEFSFFGIKGGSINVSAMLWLVSSVLVYFLASFLLHAIPEFLAWLARYNKWKHEQFELS